MTNYLTAVFLPLTLLSIPTLASNNNNTIGYQIHSYNDLNSWPQLFAKMESSTPSAVESGLSRATLMLKIDPQYLNESACSRQTRVHAPSPHGCLVLNHDTLSSTTSRTDMNTSADVLTIIADPTFASIFRNANHPVTISLCFKGCGASSSKCPCDNSKSSNDWLALLDEFFIAVNETIALYPDMNVEFLLDGVSNPGQNTCLANRWRPLSSMFISTDDPLGSFTSDDPAQGWDRLQVLNEPAGSVWSIAATLGFGKFASSRNRPYIVWEPSDAAGMLAAATTYLNAHTGSPHSAGFRHAINTDVATWATHTAPVTNGEWWRQSAPPGVEGNVTAPRHFPLLATANIGNTTGNGSSSNYTFALSLSRASIGDTWMWTTWVFSHDDDDDDVNDGTLGLPVTLSTGVLPHSVELDVATTLSLILLNNGTLVGLIDGCQGTRTLLINIITGSVSLDTFYPPLMIEWTTTNTTNFATSFVSCTNKTGICQITAWSSRQVVDDNCFVYIAVSTLGAAVVPAIICAAITSSVTLLLPVSSLAISSAVSGDVLNSSEQISASVIFSMANTLYGATMCAPVGTTAVAEIRLNNPNCFGIIRPISKGGRELLPQNEWQFQIGTNQSLPFYVGDGVGVSITSSNTDTTPTPALGILIIASSSHCANNEHDNKRDDVALCDVVPIRGGELGTAYIAYFSGSLQNFAALLLGAESTWRDSLTGGASACSALIATGMVTTGAGKPAPALIFTSTSQTNRWHAIAHIEGAVPGTNGLVPDPQSCGVAPPAAGDVILLSFPIPQAFF